MLLAGLAAGAGVVGGLFICTAGLAKVGVGLLRLTGGLFIVAGLTSTGSSKYSPSLPDLPGVEGGASFSLTSSSCLTPDPGVSGAGMSSSALEGTSSGTLGSVTGLSGADTQGVLQAAGLATASTLAGDGILRSLRPALGTLWLFLGWVEVSEPEEEELELSEELLLELLELLLLGALVSCFVVAAVSGAGLGSARPGVLGRSSSGFVSDSLGFLVPKPHCSKMSSSWDSLALRKDMARSERPFLAAGGGGAALLTDFLGLRGTTARPRGLLMPRGLRYGKGSWSESESESMRWEMGGRIDSPFFFPPFFAWALSPVPKSNKSSSFLDTALSASFICALAFCAAFRWGT